MLKAFPSLTSIWKENLKQFKKVKSAEKVFLKNFALTKKKLFRVKKNWTILLVEKILVFSYKLSR